jgi:F-type H+-transporting ATPase subunit b
MITINATLVLQVIHFLILAFILNRIMIRPILRLIQERNHYVSKSRRDIEDLDLESRRLAEMFQRKELEAKRDALTRRNELKDMGILEVQQISEDSQQKAKAMKAKAEQTAEKQVMDLSSRLDQEAAVLADEIVDRVMDRRSDT